MSVPKGERGKSSMEFVHTANIIEKRAMEVCKNWPKRYMFIITQRTINLASELYECVQKANAIIPKTEAERTQRVILLERAMGANYAFSQKIERAFSMFPLCTPKKSPTEESEKSFHILQEFMEYCKTEDDALRGNLTFTRNMELGKPPPGDS